jgi:uncharacterized protein DUF4352
MRVLRLGVCALVVGTAVSVLVACSDGEPEPGRPTSAATTSTVPTSGATASGAPTASSTASPTATATTAPTGTPVPTSSDEPVPKVGRSGAPASPTVSAKPAKVDGTVRYSDGLSLKVVSVDFAKETKKGPGSFPGREYAVLTLQVINKTDRNLSMDTVVVTVLDKADQPVAPVYTDEAEVSDFAGTLKAGKTASARYAFAVPKSSRSKVTVVVDFDGAHTSAVFRGKLT